MLSTPRFRAPALRLAALAVAATALTALATVPIDDFNDGDDAGWTHVDLLDLLGLGPSIYDASGMTYQISSSNPLPPTPSLIGTGSFWTESAFDPFYSEGYMRLRFSSDNLITNPFAAMRMDPTLGNYYTFYSIPEGDGTIGISKVTGFTDSDDLVSMDFAIAPGTWYWMEAGTLGSTLSLKVWPEGGAEPPLPQLTVDDTDFALGALSVGLYKFAGESGVISSQFDDITFIPEPVTGILLVLAAAVIRRR